MVKQPLKWLRNRGQKNEAEKQSGEPSQNEATHRHISKITYSKNTHRVDKIKKLNTEKNSELNSELNAERATESKAKKSKNHWKPFQQKKPAISNNDANIINKTIIDVTINGYDAGGNDALHPPEEFNFRDAIPLNPDGSLPPALKKEIEEELELLEIHNKRSLNFLQKFLGNIEKQNRAGHLDKVIKNIDDTLNSKRHGPLKKVWGDVKNLTKMMHDPSTPWHVKAFAIGALVYVITPIDAIPDILPMLGLGDDVAVVLGIISYIGRQLKTFTDKEIPKKLEEQGNQEIKKHLHKNRISFVYAAAIGTLTLLLALAFQYFNI